MSVYVAIQGTAASVKVAANIPTPPTNTPRPAPTKTPPPAPTNTPKPQFAYSYQNGSMIANPNCGTVYLQGKVVDSGGNGINNVTVELEFFGNRVYRVSGVGKNAGEFGFTPLAQDNYHTAVPFNLRLIQAEGNPSPLSDSLFVDFRTCDEAGQFTNIVFRKN